MKRNHFNTLFTRCTFVMCSPFLMVFGVNLSALFFLPVLYGAVTTRAAKLFRIDSTLKLWVLLFIAGATASTFHNWWTGQMEWYRSSLQVYPNYVYWSVILLVLASLGGFLALDYDRIFGAIAGAVVFFCVYYVFFQPFVPVSIRDLFFKRLHPNIVSFLLISFVPHLVYWLRKRSRFLPLLVLAMILAIQLVEGRRAGFVLILAGGLAAYYVHLLRFSLWSLLRAGVVVVAALVALQAGPVRELIHSASPRVASLVYGGVDALDEERSFLTRLAMIEKGYSLFAEDMWFGVGLNNFMDAEGEISGAFEGSQFVIQKNIHTGLSSHNSYLNLLAEGGLSLFVPFVLIYLNLLWGGLRRFPRMLGYEKVILISFCMMSVHLFFINAIVNVFTWFNIGLLAYVVTRLRRHPVPVPQLHPGGAPERRLPAAAGVRAPSAVPPFRPA